ncbi:MAG: amidohydrolase family protein [Proteobacteria bacterium]|nr:amidohydrolase family protein [Pseudomonadota bacterium]
MRHLLIVSLALIPSLFAGSARAEDIVFENVTVLTMGQRGILPGATVVVAGDRFLAVGEVGLDQISAATRRIDGSGKYLIPGLAEMHGHLPSARVGRQAQLDTLFLYVARGVTVVRGMLGHPLQFELRDQIKAGRIIGPNLYLAAPSLNGNTVDSPEQARRLVRRYHAEGWDLQKIHPGLTLDEYDAIFDVANALGFPVGGHVPAEVPLAHAIARGQVSIDHLDGFLRTLGGLEKELSAADLQRAVDLVGQSGVWLVPTEALFELFGLAPSYQDLKHREELKYVDPRTLENWRRRLGNYSRNLVAVENRRKVLKALSDAGARIVLGSDAPQLFSVPGFSILREIEAMKVAGMSAEAILISGTRAAGIYFADKDRFGIIEAGARADAVLLEANPLDDIMNLAKQAGVMVQGRWYSKAFIDGRLEDLAKRMAAQR